MFKTENETIIEKAIINRKNAANTNRGYKILVNKIIIILIVGYILFTQFFLITQVTGNGMFPAIKDGDLTIVFKLEQKYRKNDVISYKNNKKNYIGRVVACENDVVTINENGNLIVNGTIQDEEIMYPTYEKEESQITYPYRVPEGCVFVLGDYRTQTEDSRDFGPISKKDLEGKVITILRRRGL